MSRIKCGLKTQSIIALLISLGVSVLAYIIMHHAFSAILDNYFEKSTYISMKSMEYLDSLEYYITDNDISATDRKAIDEWCEENNKVTIIIYINRDGENLYDSLRFTWQNGEEADTEEANVDSGEKTKYSVSEYTSNSWFFQREMEFDDGPATVSLYGYFDQWIYDATLMGEIVLSAAVLCFVFICLIRRKINYVLQLDKEIKVLETGGLDFPVSVRGNDELSSLADSLNQMRIALSDNIRTESAAVKSNYDLVVAVSHDLRTPLTSLALYLDLIHAGKYKSDEQLKAYLEKSRSKVSQIKEMTDQLFERFYLEKGVEKELEKPEYVRIIFEDIMSNLVNFIAENGFEVQTDIAWPQEKASVSVDYINRIFDNISSNLLKYADFDFPVRFTIQKGDDYLRIFFSNHIRQLEEKPDSTRVGVENIQFMMDKMNGECSIVQNDIEYKLCLFFKLDNSREK